MDKEKKKIDKFKIGVIISLISISLLLGMNLYATGTYLYNSSEVRYDNSKNDIKATNVQGAIDELYCAATDYDAYDSRLRNIEGSFFSNEESGTWVNFYHNNLNRGAIGTSINTGNLLIISKDESEIDGAGPLTIRASKVDINDQNLFYYAGDSFTFWAKTVVSVATASNKIFRFQIPLNKIIKNGVSITASISLNGGRIWQSNNLYAIIPSDINSISVTPAGTVLEVEVELKNDIGLTSNVMATCDIPITISFN